MHRAVVAASVSGLVIAVLTACGNPTTTSAPATSAPATTAPGNTAPGNTAPGNTASGDAASGDSSAANPAGDSPDTIAFVPYRGGTWTVSIPQGWARTESGDAVLFTDTLNPARLQEVPAPGAPTHAGVTAGEVPRILASDPTAKIGAVTAVTRKSGPAIETTYTRDSAPNPVTGHEVVERHDFFHNGTELVLTLSSPVGADNVEPWRTITDSLVWAR